MLAAKSGKTDLVTSLLEFDAKVDDKDATGNSASDYANGKKKVSRRFFEGKNFKC